MDLTSVTIPNSVTIIEEQTFRGCIGLTSVTIGNSVTEIRQYAFENCDGLTSLTIPNSVTYIGMYAFSSCNNLTTVIIGSGIKEMKHAFTYCDKLTDVYCLAEKVPYTVKRAFEGSNINNAKLHVPASAIKAYQSAEPWSSFKEIVPQEKCATPTIAYADGRLKFGCETEGVEYVYEVKMSSPGTTVEGEVEMNPSFRATVYARKEGFENSDVATVDIIVSSKAGDTDGNGKVDAADLTKLIELLLKR